MPQPFAATVTEDRLDEFVTSVRQKLPRKPAVDIITDRHVLTRELKRRGRVVTEPPGMGPVRDIVTAIPDNVTVLSRSNDYQEREEQVVQGMTRAQFDWMLLVNNLTIPKWLYLNTQGADAMVNYLQQKMKVTERGMSKKMLSMMWNGFRSNEENAWGLRQIVSFDPSTESDELGPVGRIPVASVASWANVARNFDAPAVTWDFGAPTETFLNHGANCLWQVYADCGDTVSGGEDGANPDLILANAAYFQHCMLMVEKGKMFKNDEKTQQLGTAALTYLDASIVYDKYVPDDPNDPTYGVSMVLNTEYIDLVMAAGIDRRWGPMQPSSSRHGFTWEETTQFSLVTSHRRSSGVHFGVKNPVSVAA